MIYSSTDIGVMLNTLFYAPYFSFLLLYMYLKKLAIKSKPPNKMLGGFLYLSSILDVTVSSKSLYTLNLRYKIDILIFVTLVKCL